MTPYLQSTFFKTENSGNNLSPHHRFVVDVMKMAGVTKIMFSVLVIVFCVLVSNADCQKYQPNWESIDSRPIPDWYDDAKIGMFITWGVYSVPSMSSEWFWWFWKGQPQSYIVEFMKKYYPPNWTYADFAKDFRAEFYNAKKWRDLIVESGVK